MGLSLKTPAPRPFRVSLRIPCCRPGYSDTIGLTTGEVKDRGSRKRRVDLGERVIDGFGKSAATRLGTKTQIDVTNQVSPTY